MQLKRKLPHFVPLALLQVLAKGSSQQLGYLTAEHLAAIRSMTLLNRGRLSVQVSRQEENVITFRLHSAARRTSCARSHHIDGNYRGMAGMAWQMAS